MAIGREAIYRAIFAQLASRLLAPIGPFNFAGRREVPFSQLAAEQYPAFFLVEQEEDYDRSVKFRPARVTLGMRLVAYSAAGLVMDGDPNGAAQAAILNGLADAVEDAVIESADATAQTTLAGLVQQCRLAGRHISIVPALDQQFARQDFHLVAVLPASR